MKVSKKYIVCLSLIFIIFSCISCNNSKEVVIEDRKEEEEVKPVRTPKEEVEIFEGIVNGAFKSEDLFDGAYDEIPNLKNEKGEQIKKVEIDIMKYTWMACEVVTLDESIDNEGKKATVNGEYKLPDVGKVVKSVLDEKKFVNKKDWEQVYYDEVVNKLKDKDCEKISVNIVYNLELKENRWGLKGNIKFSEEMEEKIEESMKNNIPNY